MRRLKSITFLLVVLTTLAFAFGACVIVDNGSISIGGGDNNSTNTNTTTNTNTNTNTSTTATNVYVSLTNGNDTNDGLSPSSPVKTIEKALGIAKGNDYIAQIKVTAGTINVTSNFIIEIPRHDYNRLTISGGWREDFSQNDGYTVLNGGRTAETVLVIRHSTNVNIEKFTIQGGTGTGAGYPGGVQVSECQYISIDAIIQDNIGGGYGSGISVGSSPNTTIKGLIAYNTSTNVDYPSVYIESSPFTVLYADVVSNYGGGGVAVSSSGATEILGGRIMYNDGVPLSISWSSNLTLSNLTISNNGVYPVKILNSDVYLEGQRMDIYHDLVVENSSLRLHYDYSMVTIYGNLYLENGTEIPQYVQGYCSVQGNVYIDSCTNLIFTNISFTSISASHSIYVSNSVSSTIDISGNPIVWIYSSKDTTVKGNTIPQISIKSSTNTIVSNWIGYCSNGGVLIEGSESNFILGPVYNNTNYNYGVFITNSSYTLIGAPLSGNVVENSSLITAIDSSYIRITNNIENNISGSSTIEMRRCSNIEITSPYVSFNQSAYTIYLTNVDSGNISGVYFTNTYSNSSPAAILLDSVTNLSIRSNQFCSNPSNTFKPILENSDINGHQLKANKFSSNLVYYYHDFVNGDLTNISDVNDPLKTGASSDSTNNETF